MIRLGATAIRQTRPDLPLVLGGISPIDSSFTSVDDWHVRFEVLNRTCGAAEKTTALR